MPMAHVNETALYYETRGNGIPIVFLHPPLLSSANFRYQQLQLPDEFQIITYDMRGHGKSAYSPTPLAYGLLGKDLIGLLDHLRLSRVILCGYSTGGGLALEAMLAYPQRFLGAVLVSAMPEVDDLWLKFRLVAATRLSGTAWTNHLLAWGIAWGNADRKATFRELMRAAAEGNKENQKQYFKASLHYACGKRVDSIRHPVLLLYGEKDKRFHKYAQQLQDRLPEAELILLPQAKHQIPTKEAAQMNKLLSGWVKRHFWPDSTRFRNSSGLRSSPDAHPIIGGDSSHAETEYPGS
ncbi:alpha/beta fold hydrolase [Paenibacillus koleovorans]|uniref:alpha/beta fold hydrolase n=1 Tax=Paenibacillus koleovorans TaxID=121608 RepID=UPI000FD73AD1|nr:alpha/beta hydrolase [Paenibacillus koleovorans]